MPTDSGKTLQEAKNAMTNILAQAYWPVEVVSEIQAMGLSVSVGNHWASACNSWHVPEVCVVIPPGGLNRQQKLRLRRIDEDALIVLRYVDPEDFDGTPTLYVSKPFIWDSADAAA